MYNLIKYSNNYAKKKIYGNIVKINQKKMLIQLILDHLNLNQNSPPPPLSCQAQLPPTERTGAH